MGFERSVPQSASYTNIEKDIDPLGESKKATRISLIFTVSNPIRETDQWSVVALFAPVARALAFMGAKDLTLEGAEIISLKDDNS